MSIEELTQPWIISHGDYTEYSCETHAAEFAAENDIPRTDYGDGFAIIEPGYGVVSECYPLSSWDGGEADYPVSCQCGQYLDVSLTRDGRDYMLENDFPAWLMIAHGVSA